MKTIFLFIPNHIFISDLLRTKYIGYLAQKYKVVLFTPMIDEVKAKEEGYLISPNITYVKRKLENPHLFSSTKLFRLSCIREFDYLSSIRHHYKRDIFRSSKKRRWLRSLSWLLSVFLTSDFFTRVETLFSRFEELSKWFEKYKPDLVITATPGLSEFEAEAIILAKKLRVPTLATNFSWDNLTMNAKHIRKPDYLFVWNDVLKQEAIKIHKYRPERVFVTGAVRFDIYFEKDDNFSREVFLYSKGLKPEFPTILYTTVTKVYPFQKKYIDDLIQLRQKKEIPYVNIFVRVHPRDEIDNYREFFNVPDLKIERAGRETFDEKGEKRIEMNRDDLLNLRYLLKYSDLNINYASTISVESFIFDKPVINIGWIGIYKLAYDFVHYKPIVESGAVKLMKDDADLPKYINSYLRNPASDRENRRRIKNEQVVADSLSYKRCVDFLEKIIENRKNVFS